MKTLTILAILATFCSAEAQMQSITTYGGTGGLQTTTFSPNGAGGYNYTIMGGPRTGEWGGVNASPGTTVSAAVGPQGSAIPIVTPNASQTVENDFLPMPIQIPIAVPVYYPVERRTSSLPKPTPEMWVDLYTGKQVSAPAGLKHTAEGEPLINPYTHEAIPTEHPPKNPNPWQQFLIDCKVPSNKLMRERTLALCMAGYMELQSYKMQIGHDTASEKKYSKQFTALLAPLSADQKAQIRLHLCEDFGVKDPKYIETKEMIPYLRQWIRANVARNVATPIQ